MSMQAIDISSNNEKVDVTRVTAPIIINKLTGGLNYYWKDNLIDECLKAGKLVGAYHFEDEYNVHSKIKLQAQYFYSKWNHTINEYIKKHNMIWFAQYGSN